MTQSPIDLRKFRKLIFFCPVCSDIFRHFSIPYHIFQKHFEYIYDFLSDKEIAKCYVTLMVKEKVDFSLENFSNLTVLFERCEFRGISSCRENAENSIKTLKKLDIKKYFGESFEAAMNNLKKK